MARHICSERNHARSSPGEKTADKPPLPQQSRRNVSRRDGEGWTRSHGLGARSLRGRLRQRRKRRSFCDVLRKKCPVSQQRERNFFRRQRQGGRCRERSMEERL